MSQQQNKEVVMSQSRVLTRVVGSNKYLCNVCNEEMIGKTFESLKCENGHVIGEVHEDGALITAETYPLYQSNAVYDTKHRAAPNRPSKREIT